MTEHIETGELLEMLKDIEERLARLVERGRAEAELLGELKHSVERLVAHRSGGGS